MGIEEYLQAVCDEQSFMAFVDALVQDRLQDAAARPRALRISG